MDMTREVIDKFYTKQHELDRNYTMVAYLYDLLPLYNFRPSNTDWYKMISDQLSYDIEEHLFNLCVEYCIRGLSDSNSFGGEQLNEFITSMLVDISIKDMSGGNIKVKDNRKFDFEVKSYITRLASNINILTNKVFSTRVELTDKLVSDRETDISKYSDLYTYFMDNRTGLYEICDLSIELKNGKFNGLLEFLTYDKAYNLG